MYRFFVDGPPVGKGRPRVYRGRAVTPKRTVEYEARVAAIALVERTQGRHGLLTGPVRLCLEIYHPRPTKPKRDHECLRSPWCTAGGAHPDASNVTKIIEDALNGVLWVDDCQVVDSRVERLWTPEGGECGVWVTIEPLGPVVEMRH